MRHDESDDHFEHRLRAIERELRQLGEHWVEWLTYHRRDRRAEAARMQAVVQLIVHGVVAVALITAAVTLTVTGHDSTPAWAALGAYIAGAGVQGTRRPSAG